MLNTKKRIAILTGGGDCPGLNAVIRAVCTTAQNEYDVETIGFLDGFEGLYNESFQTLVTSEVWDLLQVGGTVLGTTNKGHYFFPLAQEVIQKSVETYKKLDLICIVCIGGDGTMSIAHKLSEAGINVVGVPKTIDNDLGSTDQTFGFDSAVSVVTEALDRLQTTAASHHRVMVVEVMGRNAGWIALNSGVAGGASVILLPEVKWQWESIMKKIKNQCAVHRSHSCIVVVSEGCHLPEGGQVVINESPHIKRNEKRLGGIGNVVAEKITEMTGIESRLVVLGHTQRGGSPTCFDRVLGTKFGSFAAKLACEGQFGKMAALRSTKIVAIPITENISKQRTINMEEEQLVWAAKTIGIAFGD